MSFADKQLVRLLLPSSPFILLTIQYQFPFSCSHLFNRVITSDDVSTFSFSYAATSVLDFPTSLSNPFNFSSHLLPCPLHGTPHMVRKILLIPANKPILIHVSLAVVPSHSGYRIRGWFARAWKLSWEDIRKTKGGWSTFF